MAILSESSVVETIHRLTGWLRSNSLGLDWLTKAVARPPPTRREGFLGTITFSKGGACIYGGPNE
jgi:hypothetical protein